MDSYLKTDLASSQSGFSLIEVLIAMGILARSMLAAAIIPRSTLRHRQLPGGCTVLAGIFLIPSVCRRSPPRICTPTIGLRYSSAGKMIEYLLSNISACGGSIPADHRFRNEKAPGPEGAWRFFYMNSISLI